MEKDIQSQYDIKGPGKPQIILIGNGLERCYGQASWSAFLEKIAVRDTTPYIDKKDEKGNVISKKVMDVPFPLLYELLSLKDPAPLHILSQDIKEQEDKLAEELRKLDNVSNELTNRLPSLGADHVFTTNYPYCIEKAFWPDPGSDFSDSRFRSSVRFNLNPEKKNGKQVREVYYRLHSGYETINTDESHSRVRIWHIHGEIGTPRGVVVGSDRYGRTLNRIIECVSKIKYKDLASGKTRMELTSWPELFLFGDVYIIGLGIGTCETDLWWLLRRKQREKYNEGQVFLYEYPDPTSISQTLLQAHGVTVVPIGAKKPATDEEFRQYYRDALDNIANKIKHNKDARK